MEVCDWLLKNFNQRESGFSTKHSEQNESHHVKEREKLCPKMV